MNLPIIKTKLYVPKLRSKVVNRTKLLKQLDANTECKLILISAPAGFGKTTLISEWITNSNFSHTWLSLEDKDNDLIRFLSYFVCALQVTKKNICSEVLEMLPLIKSIGLDSIVTAIINEIEKQSDKFIFVLDDYHLIQNTEINDVLMQILDHLPLNMHFVIITREDPDLSLSKLRSKNQLMELRSSDLRFSYNETNFFLTKIMNIELTDDEVKKLKVSTEGWIAGLQLVALSIQKQPNVSSFIDSFSGNHHFIMDYLIEEVLDKLPKEILSFMLKSSILNRIYGPLCDSMMDISLGSSQQILEYIQDKNLFIIPLDNERKWYRYHHLLLDILRKKLTKESTQTLSDEENYYTLHLNASIWFEKNDLIIESIHHSIEGRNYTKAAALLEISWPDMDKNLQSALWLSLVQMIPDEVIETRPVLSVGYAWALLDSGEFEDFEKKLQIAEQCIDIYSKQNELSTNSKLDIIIVDEKQYEALPATISAARAYYSLVIGDIILSIDYAKRALELIPNKQSKNKEIINTILGLAQWTIGNVEEALRTLKDNATDIKMEVMLAVVLAELSIEQGHLNQATQIYERALYNAIHGNAMLQLPIASLYLGLGKVYLLKGNLNEVDILLQKSLDYSKKVALPNWKYQWYLLKVRTLASKGEYGEARELLCETEKYYFKEPLPDIYPLDALKTRILIKESKINKAIDWYFKKGLNSNMQLNYTNEYENITFVRVLIEEFKNSHNKDLLNDVKQFITRLLYEVSNKKRTGKVIELYILQALLYKANGDLENARKNLIYAVNFAKDEEYIQVFIDEGIIVYDLIKSLDVIDLNSNFFLELIKSFEKIVSTTSLSLYHNTNDIQMKLLTKRESEILLLIAQGLSNKEISEELFLAISTVKNYIQNLFGKLEVKNRTEAVKKAKELGIFK